VHDPRRVKRTAALCFAVALGFSSVRPAAAHSPVVTPPKPKAEMTAPWPGGRAESHDVIVPVVVTVGADGTVASAEVEATVSKELDEAALEAARHFAFEPARQDGEPIASRVRAVVRFRAAPEPAAPPAAPPAPPPVAPPARKPQPKATDAAAKGEATEVQVAGERAATRTASEYVAERPLIQAAPHRTAADLVLLAPGAYVSQHGGEGKAHQIFYRGFDAVHGQDLEIWAGGIPVNDVSNIHGQGYADLNFLMPEIVRQIRVEPGTYDPRQGDFAVAGSLRFDLGYDEPGVTVKGTFGQFGTRRFFAAYRPKDAPESTFAAFEAYGTDGFGPSRAANRTSAVAQTVFPLGGGVSARVLATGYAAHFDSAGVLRLSDIESGKVDRFATYDPKQGGSSNRGSVVLDFGGVGEKSKWSVAPYFILHSMRLRQNFTGFLPDANNDVSSQEGNSEQQLNDATTLGMTASYRMDLPLFSPKDAVEAGVLARLDLIDQSQRRLSVLTDQVTLDEVEAKIRATDAAGYVDLDLHPLRRVSLRGGVRLDGLSYTSEDKGGDAKGEARSAQGAHLGKKLTAEAGIITGLSAVASYGEGFRSPQARGLSEGQKTPFTEVQSFEIGARYRNDQLKASIAGFRTLLSEDLVFDESTARNEAVPATRRTGLALDFAALPTPWLVSSANLTYTRAEFRASGQGYNEGDLVPYAPETVIRTDLAFTPVLGHFLNRTLQGRFGAATTFLGGRPLPYGETGHDVFLVDARAAVRLKEVELSLDAFNLLDAKWYDGEFTYASNFNPGTAASLVPARHVTVGAPRTVWVSLALYL
jgi:iron complex outermembrane receptor protein